MHIYGFGIRLLNVLQMFSTCWILALVFIMIHWSPINGHLCRGVAIEHIH